MIEVLCSQILFGFDRKNGKSYKFKIKTDMSINEYRHERHIKITRQQ